MSVGQETGRNARFKTSVVTCSVLTGLCAIACSAFEPRLRTNTPAAADVTLEQPFPSQQRLAQLGKTPVESPLAAVGAQAAVTSWSIEPSSPNADWRARYTGEEPNAEVFAEWAEEGDANLPVSAAMTCLAQQDARFAAEHPGTVPAADLRAFMQTRCGVPFETVRTRRLLFEPGTFEGLAGRGESTAQLKGEILSHIDGASSQAVCGLGVWKGRDKAVVSVLVGEPALELSPVPFRSGGDGHVEISGVYDQPNEWMIAQVTRGPLGHEACTRTPGSASGAFGFRCPTTSSDAIAVIEVVAASKGSVQGAVLARVLVSPDGSAPTQYETPTLDLPGSPGDFSPSAVLAGINALRRRAGLADVLGAPHQDTVTASLFPHLLGNSDPAVRNEAGLGVIAGWHVEQTVRRGTFNTLFHHPDTPLGHVLAGALFFPSFRATSLSPHSDVVSLAVLSDPESSVRALLSVSYDVFEPGGFAAGELKVFAALDAARADVGLPPVQRVDDERDRAELLKSAERVRLGESTPAEELGSMVRHLRSRIGRNVAGVIYTPARIEGWSPDFNERFFKHEDLAVAVAVGYFTPPGAAWGRHAVFMLFTPL